MTNNPQAAILLVEDEALIAMAEKLQLERNGYAVHHVMSGEAAVAAALSSDSSYDLILMDIDLGAGIDGTQAAEQILKQKDLPIVFLSSHTEPEIVERTEKITSYGYVVKNSGITVLSTSIKMALKLFEAKMQEERHRVALLHSRDLMGYIIEHNQSAVAVHDRERRYVYVSKPYLDQYNVKRRDVIGRHHYDVFPDLPLKYREAHDRALRGEVSRGEDDPFEREDGTTVWTRWECRPWYEADDRIGGFIVYTEVLSSELYRRIEARDAVNYLQSVLRTSRDGYFLVGLDASFLDVNETYCEMTGYSRSECLQLKIQDVDATESPQDTAERIERIRSTGSEIFESRHRRKDGTVFDVEISASFLGGSLDSIVCFGRDITDRKQAEEALQAKTDLLEKIFDNSIDPVALTDLEGNYRMVSNAHRALGYDAEHLIGRNVMDFVHPDDVPSVSRQLHEFLRSGGGSPTVVYRYRRLDGEYVWFETKGTILKDHNGRPEEVLFNTRDITERNRAEVALRQSEAESRLLLDHSSAMIWSLTPDGVFAYASPSGTMTTGYDRQAMRGERFADYVHPEDLAVCLEHIAGLIETRSATPPVTYRFRHADGSWHWHEANAAPVTGLQGEVVSIVGVSRDVTPQKQAQQEIQQQLLQKETLLKEVHHRIKNNIAQIESLLSMRVNSAVNAEAAAVLREAVSSVRSFRVLYEKLLIGDGYQLVSMKAYLDGLIDSLLAVYGKPLRLTVERQVADFQISSKKAAAVGIILNELLTNSVKYAFGRSEHGRVSVSLRKNGTRATLVVHDNGVGLDRTFSLNESSGFGLRIVRMLSEQLGGTFTVENKDGAKAVLVFEI